MVEIQVTTANDLGDKSNRLVGGKARQGDRAQMGAGTANHVRYRLMVAEPDVLNISRLSAGLFVEYLGPAAGGPDVTMAGAGDAASLCDRLWPGHPGVVSEPAPQHVLVTWVGLEEAVVSFMVGFSCDDQGSYAGLGVLPNHEYETRRSRILQGKPPTGRRVPLARMWCAFAADRG